MTTHSTIRTLCFAVALGACSMGNSHARFATSASDRYPARAPAQTYSADQQVPQPEAVERPGLGTSWGEQVHAPISLAPFQRAGASPYAEVALHYNDARGVEEHARYLDAPLAPLEVFTEDSALGISLVDESGRLLPGFAANGRTLVLGEDGAR